MRRPYSAVDSRGNRFTTAYCLLSTAFTQVGTVKASVFQGAGRFSVEDVPEPVPGPGEVVLDVEYCGICGTDLHLAHSERFPVGAVMGHEFVGTIREIGPAVADWQPGDRVAVNPFRPCGTCEVCRSGRAYLCPTGVIAGIGQAPGGYAERAAAPATNLLRLPDAVTSRQAAVIEPLAVALHATLRARPTFGDNVLIFGAGPIGLLVLQCVRLAGCRRVIVAEPAETRRATAARLGADGVIDPLAEDVVQGFRERVGAIGADQIFECAGVPASVRAGIVATKPGGSFTQVALPAHSIPIHMGAIIQREITLRGSLAYAEEFPLALDLIARGQVDVETLVSAEIPLSGVTDAFAELNGPATRQLKVLIAP